MFILYTHKYNEIQKTLIQNIRYKKYLILNTIFLSLFYK